MSTLNFPLAVPAPADREAERALLKSKAGFIQTIRIVPLPGSNNHDDPKGQFIIGQGQELGTKLICVPVKQRWLAQLFIKNVLDEQSINCVIENKTLMSKTGTQMTTPVITGDETFLKIKNTVGDFTKGVFPLWGKQFLIYICSPIQEWGLYFFGKNDKTREIGDNLIDFLGRPICLEAIPKPAKAPFGTTYPVIRPASPKEIEDIQASGTRIPDEGEIAAMIDKFDMSGAEQMEEVSGTPF